MFWTVRDLPQMVDNPGDWTRGIVASPPCPCSTDRATVLAVSLALATCHVGNADVLAAGPTGAVHVPDAHARGALLGRGPAVQAPSSPISAGRGTHGGLYRPPMCVPLLSRRVPATVPPCKSRSISKLAAPDAKCPAVSRFLSRPSLPVAVPLASHFKSVSCGNASRSVPPLSRPVSRARISFGSHRCYPPRPWSEGRPCPRARRRIGAYCD